MPFVVDFETARYLGKWYEVARLPVFIQPAGTLAVAEYSAAREEGKVIVKNTAYNAEGKVLATIEGEASIAAGAPPGRLLVRFGPAKPADPNYFVMHVDKDYQYTVVGVPDRKSLWILARKIPISDGKLKELRDIALEAGFDVSKLIAAPWDKTGLSDSRIKELLRERHATLKEVASTISSQYEAGQASSDLVYAANLAVHQAELDLCDTDKERVAVFEKMLPEAKAAEKDAGAAHQNGRENASVALKAKVNRLEIEIALERAKAK